MHTNEKMKKKKFKLSLREFDLSSIPDGKIIVIIGRRNTGKSFLIRDLLYYKRDMPVGTVISATEKLNKFFCKMIPSLLIHDELTETTLSNVLKRQLHVKLNIEREELETKVPSKQDPRSFLILDDCLFDDKWTRTKTVREIFMNGRHYNLLFIVTMQHAMGIPPNLRTNVDYTFIFRDQYISNRKRLYEHYAGMFPDFESFCSVMDQCTENYECLVICNNCSSNKLEDQVFWYKAEPHDDFKIGSEALWAINNDRMTEDYSIDEDDCTFEPSSVRKKKGPEITVNKVRSDIL